MGYNIYLILKEGVSFDPDMYVTFNYNEQYKAATGKTLYELIDGKLTDDTAETLSDLARKLGTETDNDYWKPTAGNAGKAAKQLYYLAINNPGAKWEVHK